MLPVILGALQNKASTNPGQKFSEQSANLQGSDPGMINRQLEEVNKVLGLLFVRTFQTQPNVANQISATMKALSRAIKEAQQGANTSEVVGQTEKDNQPIDFSAARGGQTGQPDQGPMSAAA